MSVNVAEIIKIMEEIAPPSLAEEWDNVGLMLGRRGSSVKKLLLALDVTAEVVQQAIAQKADMIITHHPLIFKGVKNVTDSEWQQELILTLVEHGIAVYSAHTNLDCVSNGVNDVLAKKLRLEDIDVLDADTGLGRIGTVAECMIEDFAVSVKQALKADYVVIGNADKKVHTVAVCGGAGSDLINLALLRGADTLVTGDIKYHEAQKAVFSGLNVVDAGHQPTELHVMDSLADRLSQRFAQRDMNVVVNVASETLLLKHI